MKKPAKAIAALYAAHPDTPARPVAYSGSGQWLYWHAPNGSRELIGLTLTLGGVTYRQIASPADTQDTATALWDATTAWQLGKLLDTLAAAINASQPLPVGISAEPISIANGDNPGQLLDLLWQAGPAQSLLLKKKPPSEAERSNAAQNNHAAELKEQDNPARAPAAQATPASTGAKHQNK